MTNYPTKLGEYDVAHVRDLTIGFDSQQMDQVALLPVSESSQMITFYLTNGASVTLRTSGTEPKIKYYIEYPGDFHNKDASYAILMQVSKTILAGLLQPDVNALQNEAQ